MNKKQRKWWAGFKVRMSCAFGVHNRWGKKDYVRYKPHYTSSSYAISSLQVTLTASDDRVVKWICLDCGHVKFREAI